MVVKKILPNLRFICPEGMLAVVAVFYLVNIFNVRPSAPIWRPTA